jgi:hypothetical protein
MIDIERKQILSDLAEKLKLEATFRPKIRKLFRKMLKTLRKGIIKTGRSINADDFKEKWQDILFDHHRKVQKVFKKKSQKQQEEEDEQEELLLLALLIWAERNSVESTEEITATNQKNMEDALDQARQLIIDQELPTDNKTLALTAVALLGRKFDGRIEAIQSFETQAAAESTKLTVAEINAGMEPSILSGITVAPVGVVITKKWATVGDERVRVKPFNHRAANGQVKRIDIPFEVSGQLLKFPGDRSLGASPGNVINCRCSAIYRS